MTIHSSTSKVAAAPSKDSRACIGCLVGRVAPLLAFGRQPPSNDYRLAGAADAAAHPLSLGQCSDCALIQLDDPMPPDMVRSRFPWLTYNEPEDHLDRLTARVSRLAGIGVGSSAMGLTYKDDTTLARLSSMAAPSPRSTCRWHATPNDSRAATVPSLELPSIAKTWSKPSNGMRGTT